MTDEFKLYDKVEGIAGKLIMEHRKLFKNVCANVDFYCGFVYTMLGIPEELFTPIFAIARMPGWSAHRLEELISANKIIRPAYKYVGHHTRLPPFFVYLYEVQLLLQSIHVGCCCVMQWIFVSSGSIQSFSQMTLLYPRLLAVRPIITRKSSRRTSLFLYLGSKRSA